MSTDVSVQAAFLALIPKFAVVAEQSAFVAIFPGTRVSVTEQSMYLAMFDMNPPVKRRRIATTVTG